MAWLLHRVRSETSSRFVDITYVDAQLYHGSKDKGKVNKVWTGFRIAGSKSPKSELLRAESLDLRDEIAQRRAPGRMCLDSRPRRPPEPGAVLAVGR